MVCPILEVEGVVVLEEAPRTGAGTAENSSNAVSRPTPGSLKFRLPVDLAVIMADSPVVVLADAPERLLRRGRFCISPLYSTFPCLFQL